MITIKDIYKIPNIISISRILLLPFFIYCFPKPQYFVVTLSIFLLIIVSDFLDGFISRRFNLITDMGKMLDPISDKIVTFGVIGTLVVYTSFPLWFFIVLIIRDILLIIGGLWLYYKHNTVVKANVFGKISTVALGLLVLYYIVMGFLKIEYSILPILISFAFIIIATVSYAITFYRQTKPHSTL